MIRAEKELAYIIAHRGEPKCDLYLRKLAKKMDTDIVQETLCHIWAGFYDAENPIEITIRPIVKQYYAAKRERKLADNKEHLRKLAEKRSVAV